MGSYNDWIVLISFGLTWKGRGEDGPSFEVVPGILTMIEGWEKECENVDTVIAGFTETTLLTSARSHVPAWVP